MNICLISGVSLTQFELKQLVTWENLNLDEYQLEWKRAEKMSMEYQVKDTNDRFVSGENIEA